MIRIRFHGRGGQGMKTASRILGSAAFSAGHLVQDSPLYGAERRGAPMAAFTRIASQTILERGAIDDPDLVVVADDTLLNEPAAQPLLGCTSTSTALINSSRPMDQLLQEVTYSGRLLVADFTSLVYDMTQSLAALSSALGVAAGKLVALTLKDCLAGLEAELSTAHLTATQYDANLCLAPRVYSEVAAWEPLSTPAAQTPTTEAILYDPVYVPPTLATSSIYSVGNTPQRHTGSWRQFRPVLQPDKCSACWLCFVWCPEAAISLDAYDFPVVDYDVCKGCLLCAHECPTHAFTIEKETR